MKTRQFVQTPTAATLPIELLEPRQFLHGGFLDPTLGDGGHSFVDITAGNDYRESTYGLSVSGDGSILVVGEQESTGNPGFLAKFNSNGTPDPAFGGNGAVIFADAGATNTRPRGVFEAPDGKIIVIGYSSSLVSSSTFNYTFVARFNSTGQLDAAFGDSGVVRLTSQVSQMFDSAVQSDGKILLAGQRGAGFDSEAAVWRLLADGTVDTTFGSNGVFTYNLGSSNDVFRQIAPRVGGGFVVNSGHILAFDASTSLDPAVSGDGRIELSSSFFSGDLLVQADGKIVHTGWSVSGRSDVIVQRWRADGEVDQDYGSNGLATIPLPDYEIQPQGTIDAQGRVLVAFTSTFDTGAIDRRDFGVARLTTAGSLDPTFAAGGVLIDAIHSATQERAGDEVAALAITAAGDKLVVAGRTTHLAPEDPGSGNLRGNIALARYGLSSDIEPNPTVVSAPASEGGTVTIEAQPILPSGQTVAKYEWLTSPEISAVALIDGQRVRWRLGASPGQSATLRITLTDGTRLIESIQIPAQNVSPTILVSSPWHLARGREGTLLAELGDPGDSQLQLNVNYGDGASAVASTVAPGAQTLRRTYAANGSYQVTVQASDEAITTTATISGEVHDVAGVVFADRNENARRDPGEEPIAGVLFLLDLDRDAIVDPGEPTATTDSNGAFWFDGHTSGTPLVSMLTPAGWRVALGSAASAGGNLATAGIYRSIGLTDRAAIRITFVRDNNGNGIADTGEPVESARFFIDVDADGFPDADEVVSTIPTSSVNQAVNLSAGTYTLRRLPPLGIESIGEPGRLLQITPTLTATVFAGQLLDLGRQPTPLVDAQVRPIVFRDLNGDGNKGSDEPQAFGVAVFDDRNNDGELDSTNERWIRPKGSIGSTQQLLTERGATHLRVLLPAGFTATTPVSVPVTFTGGGHPDVFFGISGSDTTPAQFATVTYDFDARPAMIHVSMSEDISEDLLRLQDRRSNITQLFLRENAFYDPTLRRLTFRLPQPLGDGEFRVFASPGGVTDTSLNSNGLTLFGEFFVLAGDANRDRNVDISDFSILAANFGLTGQVFSQGNFDYSAGGAVTLDDFTILAAQFGKTLPAPADLPGRRVDISGTTTRASASPKRAATVFATDRPIDVLRSERDTLLS